MSFCLVCCKNTTPSSSGSSTDSGSSDTLTSDYSLVFSTNRIKRQNSITTNAVYYFEIPVNAGEYALGSVDGGTGAYLMYLDIATNGGIDQQANVDTFGSIDYRSSIDVVENSILLITYELSDEQSLNISVSFSNNIYHIFATSDNTIQILITTLSTDYTYYYNNTLLQSAIKTHTVST